MLGAVFLFSDYLQKRKKMKLVWVKIESEKKM